MNKETKMETNGNPDLGNTKAKSGIVCRVVPGKRWCFTLNNWNQDDLETLETKFNENKCKFIVGQEIGENGTPHLQGYVRSETKIRPSEKFPNKRIHWEKCKGSEEENIAYCSKDGKYMGNLKPKRPLKIITDDKLYPWQKRIIEIVKQEPDDRAIYWYWEPSGCTGKTEFCKYLAVHYGAVPLDGKKNDVLYCAANHESDLYVWDIERSYENYVGYGAIEKVKTGFYCCSKYESKPIVRNRPHIFIFANFPPDVCQMSPDMWEIRDLRIEGLY